MRAARTGRLWVALPALPPTGRRGEAVVWALAVTLAAAAGVTAGRAPNLLLAAVALAVAAAGAALVLGAVTHREWAMIGLIVLLVSYAPEILSREVGTPKLLGYGLLALLVVVTLVRAATGPDVVELPLIAWLFAALAVVMLGSSLLADNPGLGLAQVADYARDATLVVLMIALLGRREWLPRIVWAFLLTVGVLALLSVFQQLTATYDFDYMGFAKIDPNSTELHRSQGPITANFFGQILVVATTFGVYAALATPRAGTRAVAAALTGACLLAIGYTASRGALVALAAVLILVLVLRRPPAGAVALGAVGLAFIFSGLLGSQYRERIVAAVTTVDEGAAAAQDSSVRTRLGENLAAVRMFEDRPILGVGPDHYLVHYLNYAREVGLDARGEERRPHSLYLETLAELGALGGLAFFSIVALALRGAWRARQRLHGRHALFAEAALVALVGFLVSSIFLHAAFPRYLWIVVAIALIAGQAAAHTPAPAAGGTEC